MKRKDRKRNENRNKTKNGILPFNIPMAACSDVRPSSVSSILRVTAGLVLFSFSYPGEYIVQAWNNWISMSYMANSDLSVSDSPVRYCN